MDERGGLPEWSIRESYREGVPCWVETLQPDADAAQAFYASVFGWDFGDPRPWPSGGEYRVARVAGREVAGIARLDAGARSSAAWRTYIRVSDIERAVELATQSGGSLLDGPRDALPAGRFAILADSTGAELGIWEAREREGAQLINEPPAWDLSSLRTTDPDAANAFYAAVFGWQAETFGGSDSQITLWRLPGYLGGQPQQQAPRDTVAVMTPLGGPSSAGATHSHWSVDFYCTDADAVADVTARLGGRVVVPPRDSPGFRSAVLADPQGATFSVSQQT